MQPKNINIDADKLIELCFKLSDLSIKYSCNFNVLENGIEPKQLGLKDILNNFITYRKKTIKRKSLFNKEKISKRLKILDGYLIAYKYLEAELYNSKPDIIIIISPHGKLHEEAFTINQQPELKVNFKEFGDLITEKTFLNELGLGYRIKESIEKKKESIDEVSSIVK